MPPITLSISRRLQLPAIRPKVRAIANHATMKKGATSELATSPYKSVAEELTDLRKTFRVICRSYAERLETSMSDIHGKVSAAASSNEGEVNGATESGRSASSSRRGPDGTSAASGQLRDLRDMLNLLRTLDVKPAAGRRKDLKKIESLIDDLRMLSDRW